MKTFYSKQEILNRLKEAYNIQKDTDLATLLGISKSTLSNWMSRDTIDYDRVFSKCEHINIDWLLTGHGSMQKEETTPLMGDEVAAKELVLPEVNYEYKGAPYYNVDFIGGFDLVLNDQTRNPDYYIDFAPYNKDGVVWCNITGHSMEPELNNGDFIAMKEMKSPIQYLPAGEIYGIVTEDYRTVKRMTPSDKDGFVRLIPTNKSPEFKPQDIPVSMICKVFAVLGSMHRLF